MKTHMHRWVVVGIKNLLSRTVLFPFARAFCHQSQQCHRENHEGHEAGGCETRKGNNRPRALFDLRDAPINVMWSIDTPVVCAVNGAAAGYGMDITLLCDMRVASENAKMAAVTAKRNVVP